MEKRNNLTNFLEKFLLLIFWGTSLLSIFLIYLTLRGEYAVENTYLAIINRIIRTAIFLYIIHLLRNLLISIKHNNPFKKENIVKFRSIGYLILGLGLYNTIINFPNASGSLLIGTPYGGIEMGVLNYIILGSLALVMSEVFKQAYEIKKENELTI